MCTIPTCWSIPRFLFRIVFEFSLKGANKKSKVVPVVLLAIAMINICQSVFAQEGSSSSSLKDLSGNRGIERMAVTTEDVGSRALAEAATSGKPGNDSPRIPFPGNCFLPAAKSGYNIWPALDVTRFSGTIPVILADAEAGLRFRPSEPKPGLSRETGEPKSYLIPALEIPGFVFALNGFDRLVFGNEEEDGKRIYSTNLSTFWDHLIHGPWQYDKDAFDVNQLEHPYHGSVYHGFARSAGLNFWESLGYTFAGSFLWETAGETANPSINDQVASGIAGSFFGEALFRMANLILENGGGKPGFWRELGAAVLSPPTGFNRLMFGDRFKAVFPSRDPAIFQWVRLGEGLIVSSRTGSDFSHRNQERLSYSMSYGLPGKPDYSYKRPFDYFQFEVSFLSRDDTVNVATRGLLLGKQYEAGDSYRGVWGLYGSFDYVSPRFFRVSSTAASLGTTAQWWLAPAVALQGTVLGGIGLGAGGKTPSEGERDYHFGAAGRGLLTLRLILGDLAMLDMTSRGYYISSLGGSKPKGSETIGYLEAGLTFRIYGHHAFGIQYVALRRDPHYPGLADTHQTLGTINLLYTLLGDTRFGAVEWRGDSSR